MNAFLSEFSSGDKKVFLFTLNQDIFVERYLYEINPAFPGMRITPSRFLGRSERSLEDKDIAEVPCGSEVEDLLKKSFSTEKCFYIKLHGSYDWRDKENRNILVIGTRKKDTIDQEPLLKSYFDLFSHIISRPNSKLLIIGYGFKDKHINSVIADAVKYNNLSIYVITPDDPEYFRYSILGQNQGWNDAIWKGIRGYYPYRLSDIFPHGDETHIYKCLIADYFS